MNKEKKTLYTLCFIGLIAVIFSVFILTPKVTFAEASEEVISEEKININTAMEEELIQLKRIGPKLASRIIEYREQHGPFEKIEDILKIKRIGPKFWELNKDRITVGEETTESP